MDEYGPECVDLKLSRHLGIKVKAVDKQCFYNAWSALPFAPDGSFYVEGYACGSVLAALHGWIEAPDRIIIDPTPCFHENERPWLTTYFPAKRWTFEQMNEDTLEIGELPFFNDEFGVSFMHRGHRMAFRRAQRHTYGVASGFTLENLNRNWPNEWELTVEEEAAAAHMRKGKDTDD